MLTRTGVPLHCASFVPCRPPVPSWPLLLMAELDPSDLQLGTTLKLEKPGQNHYSTCGDAL